MLKEAGLSPRRCKMHGLGARDSAAPSSIIADACCACTKAKKKKQTKDKNGCEAARKEEERQIDNSGFGDLFFFFVIKHPSLCFCSANADETCRWMGRGREARWRWLKGSLSCGDSAADLWGLPRAMKSGARGGKGLCKNLSVCNLSRYHSPLRPFFPCTDLWAGY